MNPLEFLKKFVLDNNIKEEYFLSILPKLNKIECSSSKVLHENGFKKIFSRILSDLFKLNSENLKKINSFLIENKIKINSFQKKLLLNFLNYRYLDDLTQFLDSITENKENLEKEYIKNTIERIPEISFKNTLIFFRNYIKNSEFEKDKKLENFLISIYRKLCFISNIEKNQKDFFKENYLYLKKNLKLNSIKKIEKNFYKNPTFENFYRNYNIQLQNELQDQSIKGLLENSMNQKNYDKELDKHRIIFDRKGDLSYFKTETFDGIYFKINQNVFDCFKSKNEFFDYVLNTIEESFRILVNNKVFSIEICDIFHNKQNLKWNLYSYIGIYSENFIDAKEKRKFFEPQKIAFEMLKSENFTYLIQDKFVIQSLLKEYYKTKIEEKKHKVLGKLEKLLKNIEKQVDLTKFLEKWAITHYGFTFTDCFVIQNNKNPYIIKNHPFKMKESNKLLYVFYKYRMDERDVPCIECGSLNVRGNSYQEIGHKSWECNNPNCKSRSKSNRGKRFTFKTNYMQKGILNQSKYNLISNQLIKKWRKDIVYVNSDIEIYEMFLKYFSFQNEKVLFINGDQQIIDKIKKWKRKVKNISCLKLEGSFICKKPKKKINGKFDFFFKKGSFINKFIKNKSTYEKIEDEKEILFPKKNKILIATGDTFNLIDSIPKNSISAAVTSPPYFNARDYSIWDNIFLYLIDMFNIIKKTFNTIDSSGIFLYNIGDVVGNEMIKAKSCMGKKRLLLGAYSIILFENSGYNLVENFIWDKGEPQSKRNTNNGNFTPHYQKPINSYEHMFIFEKKPFSSKPVLENKEKLWKKSIVNFPPVHKINSKGENLIGHTAPFPENIPDFVCEIFKHSRKSILDPFLGSGTTLISVKKKKLSGIGFELSEKYAKLAKERIEKIN